MRILIVENDAAVAQGLAALLRAEGYACDVCATLGCAEAALAVESFDAVLLDLGLPDGDGLVGLQRWRADSRTTPVLVLTARDALPQRVVGLDAGADDDLVKSFAPEEWLARLRVALRAGEPCARASCSPSCWRWPERTRRVPSRPSRWIWRHWCVRW
jgi:DNA-binding response OmpR family regulator